MTSPVTQSESNKDSEKSKLVRDTFSMPNSDYQLIAEILERNPAIAARFTKSEIVRAGLKVLHDMDDEDLAQVLNQVHRLKTGRPAKRRGHTRTRITSKSVNR